MAPANGRGGQDRRPGTSKARSEESEQSISSFACMLRCPNRGDPPLWMLGEGITRSLHCPPTQLGQPGVDTLVHRRPRRRDETVQGTRADLPAPRRPRRAGDFPAQSGLALGVRYARASRRLCASPRKLLASSRNTVFEPSSRKSSRSWMRFARWLSHRRPDGNRVLRIPRASANLDRDVNARRPACSVDTQLQCVSLHWLTRGLGVTHLANFGRRPAR